MPRFVSDMTPEQKAIMEAHGLLVWTYQDCVTVEFPERRWWHVKDLHPGVVNRMNAAERALYHALLPLFD